MRQINILNGDCAYEEWTQAGLPGEVLIWRENYLQGRLPVDNDCFSLEKFNQIRAQELLPLAPGRSLESIEEELDRMHRILLSSEPEDTVVLWFDMCPFDRTMLARILVLLATMVPRPKVELICRDVAWSAANFSDSYGQGIVLQDEDFHEARRQWDAFVSGAAAPETLLEYLIDKCNSDLSDKR